MFPEVDEITGSEILQSIQEISDTHDVNLVIFCGSNKHIPFEVKIFT